MNEYLAKIQELKSLSLSKIKQKVDEIRDELDRKINKIITYSKNFTVSLSNYCRNKCAYCFYNHHIQKEDQIGNTILISNSNIDSLINRAKKFNCKEALLISGESPDSYKIVKNELIERGFDSYLHFLLNLCENLLDLNILPHTNVGLITFDDMKALKSLNASMGLMLESTCKKLSMKGGVHEFSPGKLPEKRIEFIENAGKLKIPFTTGILLGIGENEFDRINDLILINKLHKKYGHIQEVILQNFIAKPSIQYHPKKTISIKDVLKTIGYAKIIMGNEIGIQIPPNLLKGYEKKAISMGIDDFGGISPITLDYINPDHPWPMIEYLKKICKKEGYELKERLPIYDKYIKKDGFCSKKVRETINKIKQNDV
jgi:FO synthase subunit 1